MYPLIHTLNFFEKCKNNNSKENLKEKLLSWEKQ